MARTQVEAFCGAAEPGDFSAGSTTISFSGAADDWGYRRFVLHHAKLAAAAGGVDAFLIGSELRGLTTLRDEDDAFPFVEALCDLAAEVRTVVGPATKISYGADWSEYFGHHSADGNVYFHLDPLWAHPDIDAVGIDNYMPLADWRDEDYGGGNPDGFSGPCDPLALRASIATGEGFDWHYPDAAARLAALETADGLVFRGEAAGGQTPVQISEMVVEDGQAVLEKSRTPDHQLPAEAVLSFRDPLAEYQTVSVRQARFGAPGSRQETIGFSGSLDAGQGRALLGDRLRRLWNERERIGFAVSQPREDIAPGALVRLAGGETDYLVTEIEDGLVRKVSARQVVRAAPTPWRSDAAVRAGAAPVALGRPLALFLDLPAVEAADNGRDRFLVAAWQKPWKSQAVFASPEDSGYSQRAVLEQPADIGRLLEALPAGSVFGRVDHSASLTVELFGGASASVSRAQLLNGANAVAVRSGSGAWEVLQFESAEEIAPDVWQLGGLLRGQLGTDDAAASGAAEGAWFVVLDGAVRAAGLQTGEEGLALHWRVGRSGADFSDANFTEQVEIGGLRALRPLSPVHMRSSFAGGDLALSWIRRGRVGADSWTAVDIPLGEQREEYRVDIAHAGGAVVRSVTVATTAFAYSSAEIAADFGAPPDEIDVTVRQLSAAVGWGLPMQRRVALT